MSSTRDKRNVLVLSICQALFNSGRGLMFLAATLVGAAPPPTADVTVVAVNLRNHEGVVRACLTNAADHFPSCKDSAESMNLVRDAAGTVTMTFENVAPGRYAVALLHDENDNGKADRVLGMMPREGFGFSNDAPVNMGPPAFGDAAIEVGAHELHQSIRMRYML